MRLFVALALPADVAFALSMIGGGIHGARWEPQDKLHLTLRYIGEVDGGMTKRVTAALRSVAVDPFNLAIKGVGHFPPRGSPRSVWAGVDDKASVTALHEEIEDALAPLDIEPDRRNFAPHVTLARLKGAPDHEVAEFLTRNALLSSESFLVDRFSLWSSIRHPAGSRYQIEREYPL